MNKLPVAETGAEFNPGTKREPLDLRPFFAPRAVAVIGAAPKRGNLGRMIVHSLRDHQYSGDIVTVHPSGAPVANCAAVTDIKYLPKSVDLVVVAVSALKVLPLLKPLAAHGVHHLILISGGFSETGEKGEILENQIRVEARRLGLHIIGPNGMGVFSAPDRFNSFFLKPEHRILPPPGSIALISQSGAFLMQTLNHLGERGIGVHRAVNFGNRIDIGECELLEEFGRDPEVRAIGMYLESVQDGPRLLKIARGLTPHKPVVVLKGGKGERGHRAAQAHSASLAGEYAVFQAACHQTGMMEVDGLESMVDALHMFSRQPRARSNRILVVSNGGGMGVMLTDLCERAGLNIPEPSEISQFALKGHYPAYYSFRNPVDLTGSGTDEQCMAITEYLLATGEYDGLLLVLLPGTEGITAGIGPLLDERLPGNLPAAVGAYGTLFETLSRSLKGSGIPVYPTGERAAHSLELLVRYSLQNKPAHIPEIDPTIFNAGPARHWLRPMTCDPHEMQIKNLLSQCAIPVPQHIHIKSESDLILARVCIGFPLTLKVAGPDVRHKTERSGIVLNINDDECLMREWSALETIWPGRIWVEQQMPPGLDLMVGAHRDPQFGPVLLFGTGGSHVELYEDITRLTLPATDSELLSAVQSTRIWRIIKGFRGQPPLDQIKVLALLKWVSDWMICEASIESLDMNPVRLYEKDLVVLDAKITRVRQSRERGETSCVLNT